VWGFTFARDEETGLGGRGRVAVDKGLAVFGRAVLTEEEVGAGDGVGDGLTLYCCRRILWSCARARTEVQRKMSIYSCAWAPRRWREDVFLAFLLSR